MISHVHKKPTILACKEVARSELFHIESVNLRFSNGVETTYERLVPGGSGAVMIAAMPDTETILLIREYCVGTESYEWALPKGRMEKGESVQIAANRELAEETGFAAKQLSALQPLALAPGYMKHSIHLVLAENLYPCQAEGDEPEPIEVIPWKLDQLYALCTSKKITEARSIAGLFLVKEFLNHRKEHGHQ